MSTVFESAISTFLDKNGVGTGAGTATAREFVPLGLNAQKVVSKRYALKDEHGEPLETWNDIVRRVVGHVSKAETEPFKQKLFYNEMTNVMLAREFIPNTPCLVNAGKPKGQLAACFVLNVPDSIEGIMEHAQNVAIIHQTGGGTGMTYEFLRPAGSMVNSTRGVASGPVSFMNIVNQTTEVVKQGGVRRGANMGILSVTHPDILQIYPRQERPDQPDKFQHLGHRYRHVHGRRRPRNVVPDRVQGRTLAAADLRCGDWPGIRRLPPRRRLDRYICGQAGVRNRRSQ
ncbi:MAG: hypothetical protein IPG22_13055 [Acidobacteria bacterium]|nr:hypothetical protein [Acidobacteriota bacterium]